MLGDRPERSVGSTASAAVSVARAAASCSAAAAAVGARSASCSSMACVHPVDKHFFVSVSLLFQEPSGGPPGGWAGTSEELQWLLLSSYQLTQDHFELVNTCSHAPSGAAA